ncbi:hypothetical protein QUA81_05770 [Microcoleus sp. F6_B4]
MFTDSTVIRGFHVKYLTIEGQNPAKVADANTVGNGQAQSAIASSSALPAMFTESQKQLPEKSPDVAPFTNKSSETAIASSGTDKTVQVAPVSAGLQEVQAIYRTNQTAEITVACGAERHRAN